MKANRWIALVCSDEANALLENYPSAFLLLTQIAMRAKWKDCPITGLKAGEAFIGDWKRAGLHSPKAYQVAKQRLEKCKLVAFQGENKGTRAKLLDSTIFSISADQRGKQEGNLGGNEGEAGGNPGGTNKTDRGIDGKTDTRREQALSKSRGTIEELKAFAIEIELSASDGESMFHHWEANGWKNGQNPVKDWKAGMRKWKASGWLPSQKATSGPANRPQTATAGKSASELTI